MLPFLVAGVGVSMAIPAASAAALSAVPPDALGKASGISNTLQRFGAVFGVAVVTAVFDARGSLANHVAITAGYRPALAVAAGFSVVGTVTALAVRRAASARTARSLGRAARPAVPAT